MKKYLLVPFLLIHAYASAQLLMRDIFAAMPDTLLPMVTRNNRLDCIDFIENNMEARVRNRVDEYVTLEALTPDYARFRTSQSAFIELKLFANPEQAVNGKLSNSQIDSPSVDCKLSNCQILCLVKTVEAGNDSLLIQDSNIYFFTTDWQPLPTERYFRMPPIEKFLSPVNGKLSNCQITSPTLSPTPALPSREGGNPSREGDGKGDQSVMGVGLSLRYFCPIRIALSPDEPTLTLIPQIADLDKEQRAQAKQLIKPLKIELNTNPISSR